MEKGDRFCQKAFWAFLAVLCPVISAWGQAEQVTRESSQQSSTQTQAQTQPEKRETPGETANRSEKDKAKPKKVYTEEDLSGMKGNGVSVVGGEKPAESAAGTKKPDGKPKAGVVPMSGQDEVYWRGKARRLLDEIA